MTSNQDVINAFVSGECSKTDNLFSEGNVLYSFGRHFPLAIRIFSTKAHEYIYIVTYSKYSQTTSRHLSAFISAIGTDRIIKQCDSITMIRLASKNITTLRDVFNEFALTDVNPQFRSESDKDLLKVI